MREQYQALMADPAKIEAILQNGAQKATALSAPLMSKLRHAVGLRKLVLPSAPASKPTIAKTLLPSFKQYREADGQFYFKLLSADGRLLVQSQGFVSGRDAAIAIASLQQQGAAAWPTLQEKMQPLSSSAFSEVLTALDLFMHGEKTNN